MPTAVASEDHPIESCATETCAAVTRSAEPRMPEISMAELGVGRRARVSRIVGDSQDVLRLKALGLCSGRWVEVLRTGDAWIVRVLGSRVGVSHRLIDSVRLTAA